MTTLGSTSIKMKKIKGRLISLNFIYNHAKSEYPNKMLQIFEKIENNISVQDFYEG